MLQMTIICSRSQVQQVRALRLKPCLFLDLRTAIPILSVDKTLKMNNFCSPSFLSLLLFPLLYLSLPQKPSSTEPKHPRANQCPLLEMLGSHAAWAPVLHTALQMLGTEGRGKKGEEKTKVKDRRYKGFVMAAILGPGLRDVVCHWETAHKKTSLAGMSRRLWTLGTWETSTFPQHFFFSTYTHAMKCCIFPQPDF